MKGLRTIKYEDITQNQIIKFWSHVSILDKESCWLFFGGNGKRGYGMISINGESHLAHRISYVINNKIDLDVLVCHTCDNPPCVNPSHLFIGSQVENMLDMFEKERVVRPTCEDHHMAKLTNDLVNLIRYKKIMGSRYLDLVREFNIPKSTLVKICTFETWRNLPLST